MPRSKQQPQPQTGPSEKSRLVTMILGVFTGFVGGHRFYAGKIGTGIAQVCTLGGFGIWWLADLVIIAGGDFRDADGRRIYHWTIDEEMLRAELARSDTSPGNEAMVEAVEEMRSEMAELHERVDFMERMLAQVRERQPLGPGKG